MTTRKSRPWRLGLDLGTDSIGWCAFDLKKTEDGHQHPVGIRRMGVRIFADGRDPRSGAPLARERRGPRGTRRRRDRYLDRRAHLIKALIRHGLMPADPAARKKLEEVDPWQVRGEGLDRELSLYELGRALFHLNQRRGFKSNRKTEPRKDNKRTQDVADMKAAARKLDALIGPDKKNARTLGEYLYKTQRATLQVSGWKPLTPAKAGTVRARPTTVMGRNTYEFYPLRSMIEAEFAALWAAQAKHHPGLTDAVRHQIADVIFHQRPLRPVDPGPCSLDPEEDIGRRERRAPLALPLQQELRILQELAEIEFFRIDNPAERRPLTLAERDTLYRTLRRSEKLTFTRLRQLVGVDAHWGINLESDKRRHLRGDVVSVRLTRDGVFGRRWLDELNDSERQDIVLTLLDEEDHSEIVRLGTRRWGLTAAQADLVAEIPLPDGYGRLGLTALSRIVAVMKERSAADGSPIRYADAVVAAGYSHRARAPDGEVLDELPYYGAALPGYTAPVASRSAPEPERKFGRLANPTVHIGLNQLRKLVNALIDRYGAPEEIVLALARDLKRTPEERTEFEREQAENRRRNELHREALADLQAAQPGWKPPRDALLRLRLWDELAPRTVSKRRCVYTGKPISRRQLFSDEVEIGHILPFSRSLDDSPANLTVSLRAANRDKGGRSPHEAFGHSPDGYDWDLIMRRAAILPPNKRWRFRPDALDLVNDNTALADPSVEQALPKAARDDIARTGGFLARQLVDTAYLARVTRQYLWQVCDPDRTWVIPRRLTALLRRTWGLNSLLGDQNGKHRTDFRHHAIDAYVVGLTDRTMLHGMQSAAGATRDSIIGDIPDPWDGYREELKAALDRIVVSHRPDHGIDPAGNGQAKPSTSGKLHEETAYGIVVDVGREGGNVVARKAIEALSMGEIERIRDPVLKQKLMSHLAPLLSDDTALDEARKRLVAARRTPDTHAVERAKADVQRLKAEARTRRKENAGNFRAALSAFGATHRIRRMRLVKPESALVVVRDRNGKPYKAYSAGENLRVEIFECADGSWGREVITAFEANRPDSRPKWADIEPPARLLWRIHKNDLVMFDSGEEGILRVVSIWDKYLQLAGHEETNIVERYREGEFKWIFGNYDRLKELGFRRVTVGICGDVHDPAKHP